MTEYQYAIIIHELRTIREEIKAMSTVTATGLTALTQAVSDLTTAVATETSNVAAASSAISEAVAELQGSEDTQVQALAEQIESQVALINTANGNLQTATASLAPPAPAPTSGTTTEEPAAS